MNICKKIIVLGLLLFIPLHFCLAQFEVVSHKKVKRDTIEVTFSEIIAEETVSGYIIDNTTKQKQKISGFGDGKTKIVNMVVPNKVPEDYTLTMQKALSIGGTTFDNKKNNGASIEALQKSYETTVLSSTKTPKKDDNIKENNTTEAEKIEASQELGKENTKTTNNNIVKQENNTTTLEKNIEEKKDNKDINNPDLKNNNTPEKYVAQDKQKMIDKIKQRLREGKIITTQKYDAAEFKTKQGLIIISVLFFIFLLIGIYIVFQTPKQPKKK